MPHATQDDTSRYATVVVALRSGTGGILEYSFQTPFRIGRADDCEVSIKNDFVSRYHASIKFENGARWLTDLNSSNGVFVGGPASTSTVRSSPCRTGSFCAWRGSSGNAS